MDTSSCLQAAGARSRCFPAPVQSLLPLLALLCRRGILRLPLGRRRQDLDDHPRCPGAGAYSPSSHFCRLACIAARPHLLATLASVALTESFMLIIFGPALTRPCAVHPCPVCCPSLSACEPASAPSIPCALQLYLDITAYGSNVLAAATLSDEFSNDGGFNFNYSSNGALTAQCARNIGPSGAPLGFAVVGTIGNLVNETNGMAVSFDAGKSFTSIPINILQTDARYGAFPTATTWYITAGQWPGGSGSSDQPTSGGSSSSSAGVSGGVARALSEKITITSESRRHEAGSPETAARGSNQSRRAAMVAALPLSPCRSLSLPLPSACPLYITITRPILPLPSLPCSTVPVSLPLPLSLLLPSFICAVDPKTKAVRHHWAESKRGNNVVHSGRALQAPNSTYAMQVVKTTDVSR